MESSLRISYNLILFSALIFSAFIYIPGISLQMVFLVLIAFTGSILLIPVYIITGLLLPVFMQGGGIEYIYQPYFLILILFAFCAVLIRPFLGIKTSKPWVWYPAIISLYILTAYVLFFLLSLSSYLLYGRYFDIGITVPAFIIMIFSTLLISSLMVIVINTVKGYFTSKAGR